MRNLIATNERAIQREKMRPLIMISAVLVVLLIAFEIIRPGFLSNGDHVLSIMKSVSMLGLCCIGQTIVILQGGIDISIVSTIMLTNCISGEIMNGEMAGNTHFFTALAVTLMAGLIIGLLNGVLIHTLQIPAMVMTLSMSSAVKGVAYLIVGGTPRGHAAPAWIDFVSGKYFGVLNGLTTFFVLLSVAAVIILRYTTFGRAIYSIGANREAAQFSGIKVGQITIISYVISSVLAAFCGMVLVGFTRLPFFSSGEGYDLDSITAVVLGGTLITGGKGGVVGTIIGLITYICLDSFMTMISMPEGVKRIVQAALVISVLLVVSKGKKK